MTNLIAITAALLAIFGACASYMWHFYHRLKYGISSDPAVWGQLGDYLGGLLNPLLSFISIVLLIKSLNLQNQANKGLLAEIEQTRKTEKLRSFESQLFHMIDAQRLAFESLKIDNIDSSENSEKRSAEAVISIEDEIQNLRDQRKNDNEIKSFLEKIDTLEQIFRTTRIFYLMVKMITDKLSDSEGFSKSERRTYLLTLINFTDFPLLRLVLINIQFSDHPPCLFLKNSEEFNEILNEVGLKHGLY